MDDRMFRSIHSSLLSFDIEWIPDPEAARRLVGAPEGDDPKSIQQGWNALWSRYGATPANPQPYLKTILCRIVSICGVYREVGEDGGVVLKLITLPRDPTNPEQAAEVSILRNFLKAVGRKNPQLVGFNSQEADLPIVVQRSIVHGLFSEGLAERPEKPWLGMDYFAATSEASIDLALLLGRFRQMPSLHEAAVLSGIPGKVEVSGVSVPEMWIQGRLEEVVAYNEFDVLTTHLLWARMAHFIGLLTRESYAAEEFLVRRLIEEEIAGGKDHLKKFLAVWDGLRARSRQQG
ncbi:MAG: hypothetical protein ACFCU4_07550 [Puniceicoccaceae bacterium]